MDGHQGGGKKKKKSPEMPSVVWSEQKRDPFRCVLYVELQGLLFVTVWALLVCFAPTFQKNYINFKKLKTLS